MNIKQASVLLFAAVAVGLVFLFPPYSIDTGLIGGTEYVFFQHPPSPEVSATFNWWLLNWELAFILFSASTALIALGAHAHPQFRRIVLVSQVAELLLFLCAMPSFDIVLTPELTWYFLTFVACCLFLAALVSKFTEKPFFDKRAETGSDRGAYEEA